MNLKNNLRDLGYYETPHYGMTGYTDEETFKGLKKFQEDNHLTIDGVIKPGGETETALNERLKARENRASSVNENDSRLEELRNSYQDKLQRKSLLGDSPTPPQPSARPKTEEDTWGKLPETANQKPIFDRQKPAKKSSTPPNHSLQPDNLLTSEADKEAEKIDDRMQQLHDQYRNTLVRRNLLSTENRPQITYHKIGSNKNKNEKNIFKDVMTKAEEIYKKSNAKNPISTENKILDFGIGKIPLVKEWNRGFNIGKALFVTKQTYDEMTKLKNENKK